LYYYPRQVVKADGFEMPFSCGFGFDSFPQCNSSYASEILTSTPEFNRSFGGNRGNCELEPSSNNSTTIDQNGTNTATSDADSSLVYLSMKYWFILLVSAVAAFI
jgi:hypothetical protein